MKISLTLTLLYLAATASAQAKSLTDLPQCAVGCFQQAVVETTSCNPTDTACLCGGDNTVKIEKRASGCVASNCDNAEEIPALFKEVCSGRPSSELEASGEKAAGSGASAEEAPVEETPVKEAPVKDAAPVEEPPVEEPPVEEPPAEESPVWEAVLV